ncbi:plectin-like isoform X2 [Lethenteron reissneri]|uniref:plectin-like isoform X2 n=1 Tax=Lethenteron reissneri TaxID=7753 RepID=UPI002AB5FA43|nr:plectin-like isoform X2 [Lethenteron reissneri]
MEGSYKRSSVERPRACARDDGESLSSHGGSRRDRPRSTPSVNGGYDSNVRRSDKRAGSARQIRTLSDSCSEVGSSDSGSHERRAHAPLLRVHRTLSSPASTMDSDELALLRFVQELQEWVHVQQAKVDHAGWGKDMREVDLHLQKQTAQHATISNFKSKLDEAKKYENDISQYHKMCYGEHLGVLYQHYQILLVSSERRLQNLECLRVLVTHATEQLMHLNEQEEAELSFDWSDQNPDMGAKRDAHAVLMKDLEKMELTLNQIHKHGEHWLQQGHPAGKTIEALLAVLQVQWGWVLQLCLCVGKHLLENTAYFQFFRDAQDAERQLLELHGLMQKQRANSLADYRDVKKTSKVILERLEEVEVAVGNLSRKSTQIVQLKPRRPDHAVAAPLPIKAICDYKQDGVCVCQKDQAYFLQDNSRRVCWRVFLPGGTQATVPSVCYIILPPNGEAIAASERLQEMLNDVRRLWRQVHADMEAALLWHTLREEVTTVHTWTLTVFKRMKEEEHMSVMSNLQEHYEEFQGTQSTCEILGDENYAHMEANVWATQQHYKNLLKAIGQAYTPPPARARARKPSEVSVELRGDGVSPHPLPRDGGEGDPTRHGASQAASFTGNDENHDVTKEDVVDITPQKSLARALQEDVIISVEVSQEQARPAVTQLTASQRGGDTSGTPTDEPGYELCHVEAKTVTEEQQVITMTQELHSSSMVVTKSAAQSQEESYKNAEITAHIEKLKAEMAKLFGDKANMEEEMSQLRRVAAETERLKRRAEEEAVRQRMLAERAMQEKCGAEEKVLALARAEKEAAALYQSAMSEVEKLRQKAEEALGLKQQAEKEAHRLSRLRKEAMEIKQMSWQHREESAAGDLSGRCVRAAQVRLENVNIIMSQVDEAKVEADRQTARYQRQLDEVHRLKALAEGEAAARARAQAEAESLRHEAERAAQQRGEAETRALHLRECAEREMERQRAVLEETAAQREGAERELAGFRALLREMRGQQLQLAGEKEELRAEVRDVTLKKEKVEAELQTLRAQMLEMQRGSSASQSQQQETRYGVTKWARAIPTQDLEDEQELSSKDDPDTESSTLSHAFNTKFIPHENNVDTGSLKKQDDIPPVVNHHQIADDNFEEADANSETSDLVIKQRSHAVHCGDISQPSQGEQLTETTREENIYVSAFEERVYEPKVEQSCSSQTVEENTLENNSEEHDSEVSTLDGLISKVTVHKDIEKPGSGGDISLTLVAEDIISKPSLEEDILVTSDEKPISMSALNDSISTVEFSIEDISKSDIEEDASNAVEVQTNLDVSETVTDISIEDNTSIPTFEGVNPTSTGNESILKHVQSVENYFEEPTTSFDYGLNPNEEYSSDESPLDDSISASITDGNITKTPVDEVISRPDQGEILLESSLTPEENTCEPSVTVEENVTNILLEERISRRTEEEIISLSNQDVENNSAIPTTEGDIVKSTLNSTEFDSSMDDNTSDSSSEDTSNQFVKGGSTPTVEGNFSNTSPEGDISIPFLEENVSSQYVEEYIWKPTVGSKTSDSRMSVARSGPNEMVIPGQVAEGVNVTYARAVNGSDMLGEEISVQRIAEAKLDVDPNENGFGSHNESDDIDANVIVETNIQEHPSQERDVEVVVDSVETERYYFSKLLSQGGENQENAFNNRELNAFEIKMDINNAQTSTDADSSTDSHGYDEAIPEQWISVTENKLFLEETAYVPGQSLRYVERPRMYVTSGQGEHYSMATDGDFSGLKYSDEYHGGFGVTGVARQILQESSVAPDINKRQVVVEHDWVQSSNEASEEMRDAEVTLASDNLVPLSYNSYRLPHVFTTAGLPQLHPATESQPSKVILFNNSKMASKGLYFPQLPSARMNHASVGEYDKNYRAEKIRKEAEATVQDGSSFTERPTKNTLVHQSRKKTSMFQGDSSLDDKIKCMKSELELLLQTVSETSSARLHIPPANERIYRDEYDPCFLNSAASGHSSTFTPGVGLNSTMDVSTSYAITQVQAASLEDHSARHRDNECSAWDCNAPAFSTTYTGTLERTSLETKPQEVTLQGLRAPVTLNELISSKVIDHKTATQIKSGAVTVQEASRRLAPYLQGNKVIGGLYIESVRERVSIYNAIRRQIIRPGSGLQLLEAQAATGFIIEPETRRKLSVDEAMRHGVIGPEFYDKLLSAEQAVTGYKDPITGEHLSLFQAMQRGMIVRVHGLRLLEAQVATGGIIDPTFSHRLPLEVAYARGLIDRGITCTLADLSDDNKGFFDPNTDENLTYTQLQHRCVPDPVGDLLLLPLVPKSGSRAEPADLQFAHGRVKIYRDVNSLYRKIVSSVP